ncbi:MAG: hybrid sensor histidine kinase/response regulator [Syntrophorhabdaceae bacterium]
MIRIFRSALSATVEELGIICLSVAEELTSSEFGFIGEVQPDGSVHDVAISGPGWELCQMHNQTGHNPTPGDFSRYGLYGWVLDNGKSIIANDPSGHPKSVGIPEGHPPLHSFLGVPLIDGNRTIGIIALGNREDGYRDKDRELIENLSPAIVEAFSRKRTEDMLLTSEKNYRELVENVNSIVVRWKKDGTLLFINTYGLNFFGYEQSELIGKNVRILVPERDSQGTDLSGLIQDIASCPEKYVSNINQAVRHDGTHVWMSWTNRAIYNEHGILSEILAIGSDITDIKKSEEIIKISEMQLLQAQHIAHLGYWDYNLLTGKIHWSDELHRIFGTDRQHTEVNYEFFLNLVHPDDRQYIREVTALSRNAQNRADIKYRVLRPDGSQRVVADRAEVIYSPDGSPAYVMGTVLDITEREHMEEELRQSRNDLEQKVKERTSELEHERHLLQTIIDNIPVMLAMHTRDRKYPLVNKEFERLLGWSQKDLESMDIMAEFYPDPEYRKEIWDHILSPDSRWKDIKMQTRDGQVLETRWMNIRLNQSSHIGIGLDMTEIYDLQEGIRQSHKMEAIGTLAGGIAHDFNNILASIIGFTELSIEDVSEHSTVAQNLRKVLKSAIRAKEMINKMLTFSRKSSHNRECISLTPIIKDTMDFLRASIPANIELKLTITSEDNVVFAAPVEIQQIIMNLITNAYLAMSDRGGNIEITVSGVDFAADSYSLDNLSGDYVQIMVKDSGHGIPAEVMNRIFEPYYTTREPGEGTGMGLAVIYGIVKDLEGTISVETEVGSGSTFRVYIPKATGTQSMPKTEVRQAIVGNERILFIDDEILIVDLAMAALGRLGYKVTGITNPNEALNIFFNDPAAFDLVITDQAMPSLTGKELAEQFLKIRPDIPIILCTGHSATFSAEQARQIGIRLYLKKPVEKYEMAKMIRSVLDENSLIYSV